MCGAASQYDFLQDSPSVLCQTAFLQSQFDTDRIPFFGSIHDTGGKSVFPGRDIFRDKLEIIADGMPFQPF